MPVTNPPSEDHQRYYDSNSDDQPQTAPLKQEAVVQLTQALKKFSQNLASFAMAQPVPWQPQTAPQPPVPNQTPNPMSYYLQGNSIICNNYYYRPKNQLKSWPPFKNEKDNIFAPHFCNNFQLLIFGNPWFNRKRDWGVRICQTGGFFCVQETSVSRRSECHLRNATPRGRMESRIVNCAREQVNSIGV